MELIDYFKLTKRHFGVIVITTIVATSITAIVSYIIPKTYLATVILQSNQSLNIPNYSTSTQGQQNTSINSIVGLVNQSQFKNEIANFSSIRSFEVSAQLIKESNLIELRVNTEKGPAKAKILAITASKILINKVSDMMQGRTNFLIRMTKNKIRSVDSKLALIRGQIKKAKNENFKEAKKEIKLAHLQDELNVATETRKTYQDFINRLDLNNELSKTRLQVVYPAAAPKVYSSPKIGQNLLLSTIMGFLLGMGLVGFFRKEE